MDAGEPRQALRGRYLKHFERMQARDRAWLPGWNFAAFLHSTGWFWYRRMYAWSILNLLAPLFYVLFITLALRPLVPDELMGYAIAASGITCCSCSCWCRCSPTRSTWADTCAAAGRRSRRPCSPRPAPSCSSSFPPGSST
jgi:hypothetical protein